MTNAEEQMYGISVDEIRQQYGWMLEMTGVEMSAISVLSDAQEVMERNPERARQYINIAKFFLIDAMKRQQKEAA